MARTRGFLSALVVVVSGCSGGSGGGGGASTIAPATSGTTAPGTSRTTPGSSTSAGPGSGTPGRPRDFTGVWEIKGTDPARGAYYGTAAIVANGPGYEVRRLVTYASKLPTGHELVVAWVATGTSDPTGLRVQASLRRAHVAQRVGQLSRTAADKQPLGVDSVLSVPGGGPLHSISNGTVIEGTLATAASGAPLAEKWVRSSTGAQAFPVRDEKLVPLHGPPASWLRALMFNTFKAYHGLPRLVPYVSRPEFQAAIHSVPVDHTAKDYYRSRGTPCVVLLDSIVDEVSIFEETNRANAFGKKLHEKATFFDVQMETRHVDPNGMVGELDLATNRLRPSGDGALHLGCWVASQAYRFQATGDAKALANVEKGANALCLLVEIVPNKAEFARAIAPTAIAPSGYTAGVGAYAGISWLPGGNNDMLHGIEYGFQTAEQVLPATSPLRARIGAAAKSLLDNHKEAQSGGHEIFLSSVEWHATKTAAAQARYKSALSGNLKDRLWWTAGNGIMNEQGISDWSGHHLGAVTFAGLRILGGANPDADEKGWRYVAQQGSRAAFGDIQHAREGFTSLIAAAHGALGAPDSAKDILAEIPCPKPTGDARFERDIADGFCLSPYPSLPWKNDWMTNGGRVQSVTGLPLFYRGTDENYWARSPFSTGSSVDNAEPTSQDYLHAYWLGRVSGVIAPTD